MVLMTAGDVEGARGHSLGLLGSRVDLEDLHGDALGREGLVEHTALHGDDEGEVEGRTRVGDADLLRKRDGASGGEREAADSTAAAKRQKRRFMRYSPQIDVGFEPAPRPGLPPSVHAHES